MLILATAFASCLLRFIMSYSREDAYYKREEAYQALTTKETPNVEAVYATLDPEDCHILNVRIGKEITALQRKLKTFQEAMLVGSRRAGQVLVDQTSAD
jgi:hypothetical protein